jgi:hypothetical protein
MKTWHLLIPIVMAVAIAFVSQKRSNDRSLAQIHQELDLLAAQQAAPEQRTLFVRAVVSAASAGEARLLPERIQADDVDSKPAPVATERRRMTKQDMCDRYEIAFMSEPEDSVWASSARHVATERIQAVLPVGSALRAVDCRTSFCRIETSHGDMAHYKQFIDRALVEPQSSVWNGATFTAVTDSSSANIIAVSYVSREGQNLPPLD